MTTPELIRAVKLAKAETLYWEDVKAYGGEGNALRALDCKDRQEAIEMLSAVQSVSIFRRDGKIIIQ
ncbi:MAG: hypothetical protein V4563_14275 [Pseudomonadota bacterium]